MQATQFWGGGVEDGGNLTNLTQRVSDRARNGFWLFAWGRRALNPSAGLPQY